MTWRNKKYDKINLALAEKVSKGLFTNAYIFNDYVVLQSNCIVKECLAIFNHSNNRHLPKIKRLHNDWYIMPKYAPLKAKNKKAYTQFKFMRKLLEKYYTRLYGNIWNKKYYNYDVCCTFADELKKYDRSLGNAFQSILDTACNGTGFLFLDFAKVNFSVDGNGVLILRDIFADCNKIERNNRNKISRKLYKTITEAIEDNI